MEIWQIVGIEMNARFKGDDGSVVNGMRLMLVGDPDPEEGIVGKRVRNQFISTQAASKHKINPQPGQMIKFEFNRFGNICKVEVE